MKPEYREKLEELKEWLARPDEYYEEFRKRSPKELTKEEKQENIYYDKMLDELIESQDTEVLRELLNLYTKEEYFNNEMILESLPQRIMEYHPHKQITEVLCEKFDAIYDGGGGWSLKGILEGLWQEYLRWPVGRWPAGAEGVGIKEESCFPEFRRMFNTLRPRNAARFLKEMGEWNHEPEIWAMIETLREDMKKWGSGGEKEEKTETMTGDAQ
jgi:hypothetical protein